MPELHFPLNRCSITEISWWNLSLCSSLTSPRFSTKSPNENRAHKLLETCYIPYHDNDTADHSQLALSLLIDGCPGSYHKLSWMIRIWGPMKTSSLILAWLREGNFSARYANAEDSLSKAFTNYLNKPSLICNGCKKILSLFLSGLCMMLCFPCSISSPIGQSLRT